MQIFLHWSSLYVYSHLLLCITHTLQGRPNEFHYFYYTELDTVKMCI